MKTEKFFIKAIKLLMGIVWLIALAVAVTAVSPYLLYKFIKKNWDIVWADVAPVLYVLFIAASYVFLVTLSGILS